MRFSAVDACHLTHPVYRDGVLHVLTTRDGDNKILPLAWAVCETESGDTYEYFADQCVQAGLGRYLNDKSVVFSDRQKGLNKFHERFKAVTASCFKHIIANCRLKIRGTGTTFEDKSAWDLQMATTEHEYLQVLEQLRAYCPEGAAYFNDLPEHDQVFQYALNRDKVATHGHKTSNVVEVTNAIWKEARKNAPYRLNVVLLKWMGEKYAERVIRITKFMKEGHQFTKYCSDLWNTNVRIYITYM